jgi:hypothetical protein
VFLSALRARRSGFASSKCISARRRDLRSLLWLCRRTCLRRTGICFCRAPTTDSQGCLLSPRSKLRLRPPTRCASSGPDKFETSGSDERASLGANASALSRRLAALRPPSATSCPRLAFADAFGAPLFAQRHPPLRPTGKPVGFRRPCGLRPGVPPAGICRPPTTDSQGCQLSPRSKLRLRPPAL